MTGANAVASPDRSAARVVRTRRCLLLSLAVAMTIATACSSQATAPTILDPAISTAISTATGGHSPTGSAVPGTSVGVDGSGDARGSADGSMGMGSATGPADRSTNADGPGIVSMTRPPGPARTTGNPPVPTAQRGGSLPPQSSISLASTASFTVTVPPSLAKNSDAIVDAYIAGWRLADGATARPEANWTNAASEYMIDPFLTDFLSGLRLLAEQGLHTVGHVIVSATLVSADHLTANISSCIDSSHQDTVDKHGISLSAADGPGAYSRYLDSAVLHQVDGKWKLARTSNSRGRKC